MVAGRIAVVGDALRLAIGVVGMLMVTPAIGEGARTSLVNVQSSFTATVSVQGLRSDFESAQFTVLPALGATAHPLSAVYSAPYLTRSGRVKPMGSMSSLLMLDLPIFGLYPNASNTVEVLIRTPTQSEAATFTVVIVTPEWTGPFAPLARIDVVPRNQVPLDFSYYMVAGVALVCCAVL